MLLLPLRPPGVHEPCDRIAYDVTALVCFAERGASRAVCMVCRAWLGSGLLNLMVKFPKCSGSTRSIRCAPNPGMRCTLIAERYPASVLYLGRIPCPRHPCLTESPRPLAATTQPRPRRRSPTGPRRLRLRTATWMALHFRILLAPRARRGGPGSGPGAGGRCQRNAAGRSR